MSKKYDTNPLDPDFPEKVKETETVVLPTSNQKNGKTRKFADVVDTEEQTRKFDEAEFNSYNSTFGQEGNYPANYQTSRLYTNTENNDSSRKVAKVGLPENILITLPYLPFSIGLIAGILELVFVPKSEAKVRFHAAQGLAAHLGIWLITAVLGIVDNFVPFAGEASGIFWIVTTVMLIIFAVKAWKGKPVHIESVDDLTNWLEDKVKPQI